jgi:hypothetical protein
MLRDHLGSEVDRHLQRRIRLGSIDDAGVPGGRLGVLVAEHVLDGAQVARIAVSQGRAGVA